MKLYIDPDCDRSGVCFVIDGKITEAKAMRLCNLLDELPKADEVIIDAGWLNKPSDFNFKGQGNRVNSRIAMNVGMNHQAGKTIEALAECNGCKVTLHKPTTSKWSIGMVDRLLKNDHHPLELVTKNQDIIDAVALALKYEMK
jgi:hypothetical protein